MNLLFTPESVSGFSKSLNMPGEISFSTKHDLKKILLVKKANYSKPKKTPGDVNVVNVSHLNGTTVGPNKYRFDICGKIMDQFSMFNYAKQVVLGDNYGSSDNIDFVFVHACRELERQDNNICAMMIVKQGACVVDSEDAQKDINFLVDNRHKKTSNVKDQLGSQWEVNTVCAPPKTINGLAKPARYLFGLYLYSLAMNGYNYGILELARGFANIGGLCLYSSFGFKVVPSLYCPFYTQENPNNLKMVCDIKNVYKGLEDIVNVTKTNRILDRHEVCRQKPGEKQTELQHLSQQKYEDEIQAIFSEIKCGFVPFTKLPGQFSEILYEQSSIPPLTPDQQLAAVLPILRRSSRLKDGIRTSRRRSTRRRSTRRKSTRRKSTRRRSTRRRSTRRRSTRRRSTRRRSTRRN